jgi:hypothetical protein
MRLLRWLWHDQSYPLPGWLWAFLGFIAIVKTIDGIVWLVQQTIERVTWIGMIA